MVMRAPLTKTNLKIEEVYPVVKPYLSEHLLKLEEQGVYVKGTDGDWNSLMNGRACVCVIYDEIKRKCAIEEAYNEKLVGRNQFLVICIL